VGFWFFCAADKRTRKERVFHVQLLISLAGCIFIISTVVSGQTMGIKIGPVYNHFISDQQHMGSNLGFVAGLSYSRSLSAKIALSSGLEYLQMGGNLLIIEDNTRYGVDPNETPYAIKIRDCKVSIHAINIPLIVDYLLYSSDNSNITAGLGPEVSYNFMVNSDETVTSPIGSGMYVTYSQTNNETNNYEMFNLALSAKLSYGFVLKGKSLAFDFRYRFGVLPIRTGYSYLDLDQTKSDVYQGSFIFSIGYFFNANNNLNQ
jgi:hypothetical protein